MTTVIILAGGYGTRSENINIPKSLHLINKQPILYHQLLQIQDSLPGSIVKIVTGFRSDLIEEYINLISSEFCSLEISIIRESVPSGTTAALKLAAAEVSEEYLILILGDIYFHLSLSNLLEEWRNINCLALFVSHPNNHASDSDRIVTQLDNSTIYEFFPKNQKREALNLVIAGISIFDRSFAFDLPSHIPDFVSATFSRLEHLERIRSRTVTNYIADCGTPSRKSRVELDLENGVVERRSKVQKSAVFLDLDGTLIADQMVKNAHSKIHIDRETGALIRRLNSSGVPLILITNQPGIAKGFFDEIDFLRFRILLDIELSHLGAFIDDIFVCPHHPESGWEGERKALKVKCTCRKPEPGLFYEAAKVHEISLNSSFFAGDDSRDEECAAKVGVTFKRIDSRSDFNRVKSLNEFLYKVNSLCTS